MGELPSAALVRLNIELPDVAPPVAAYIPAKRTGNHIRTSGQLPFVAGRLGTVGKVGSDVSVEAAYELARQAGLNALAAAAGLAGGIDGIVSIDHVTVFVASDPSFTQQPQVANGVSELLGDVFGSAGVHTRSAVGVAVLPLDSPVEVELTCSVKS